MAENISLFINPQKKIDGVVLRNMNSNYNFAQPNGNIEHIDGIVVSMKDWENVSKGLQWRLGTLTGIQHPPHKRELIIDPDLRQLFRGLRPDAERLLKTQVFSLDTRRAYGEVYAERGTVFKQISELYPTLDNEYVKKSLEFQQRENASLLVSPSPPITSREHLDFQLRKMQAMNEISKNYVDSGLFNGNLMNILTIDPRILELPRAREKLLNALSTPKTDRVGIKLLDLNIENISQAREILNLIQDIRKTAIAKRIYLFDVLEFGYVAYCYGVNTVVMPIGLKSPYIRRRKIPPKIKKGAYYHPIDMIYYTNRELLTETRSQNYRFPCHCKACTTFRTIPNPQISREGDWNRFRRIHFLLVKNMEMAELKSTTAPLNSALIDKFSRSKQTMWVPLLEQ